MYTSHGGGTNGGSGAFTEEAGTNAVGRVEHYTCGGAGLLVTATIVFLVYPLLVAFTRPLTLLSSTAVTVVFVLTWFTAWALFECVFEWRARRASVN